MFFVFLDCLLFLKGGRDKNKLPSSPPKIHHPPLEAEKLNFKLVLHQRNRVNIYRTADDAALSAIRVNGGVTGQKHAQKSVRSLFLTSRISYFKADVNWWGDFAIISVFCFSSTILHFSWLECLLFVSVGLVSLYGLAICVLSCDRMN